MVDSFLAITVRKLQQSVQCIQTSNKMADLQCRPAAAAVTLARCGRSISVTLTGNVSHEINGTYGDGEQSSKLGTGWLLIINEALA